VKIKKENKRMLFLLRWRRINS